ncbi:MAG: CDP-diacylglycerol--glycerol-3-phosphate 3-phosphatidyltransferase [Alphaproteobacteria bacterium]
MYNLPNILTISRIVVIPLIFMSIYFTSYAWAMLAGILFVAASITDYLDGYLARAWNETSAFGRLLDPIADKLLVATALVVILAKPNMYSLNITIIPAFVILCREILVSGLREFLREVNVGLPVTKLAKWKTAFQMTALAMMLFKDLWIGWSYTGEFLLWVAATLTFITGYQYYQKSLDYVKAEEAKKVKEVKGVVIEEPVAAAVKTAKKTAAKKSEAKSSVKKSAGKKKAPAKKAKTAK